MTRTIRDFWKTRQRKKELSSIRKELAHILYLNDDILTVKTKCDLEALIEQGINIDEQNPGKVDRYIKHAPLKAARILPRKKFSTIREYADILAVAFTVAFGVRALFFQPFKIPTGSMQPTLFGIHYIERTTLPNGEKTLPELPALLHYALFATQRAEMEVDTGGYMSRISETVRFLLFPRTFYQIGPKMYELPGSNNHVHKYCGIIGRLPRDFLREKQIRKQEITNAEIMELMPEFKKGERLCDGWLALGDHLFVDRISYHFREPARGDIVVFNTEGLPCRERGYFYIKRLIGMPGDTLKIVNGKVHVKEKDAGSFVPITDFGIPEINRIYSGRGGYHGHLARGALSKGFEFEVPDKHYFMMGDNSMNSSDSRDIYNGVGPLPRRNIIGRAFFIFWPFSRRWGLPDTTEALDVPTVNGNKAMRYQ